MAAASIAFTVKGAKDNQTSQKRITNLPVRFVDMSEAEEQAKETQLGSDFDLDRLRKAATDLFGYAKVELLNVDTGAGITEDFAMQRRCANWSSLEEARRA